MQIDAYLNRIGCKDCRAVNKENLEILLRHHLEQVPFENLDFYSEPKELPLRIDALYHKIVIRRRGGVCCELNSLFCWLLRELGYDCYPVLVRVVMPGAPAAISHQGIVVRLEGQKFYVDVGFGGPGPKGLVRMDDPAEQHIYGEVFRTERTGMDVTILGKLSEGFVPVLQFPDLPAQDGDFAVVLFYFTGNPKSYFVGKPIVNLCLPDGSKALTGNRLTIRRGSEVIQRTLETQEAFHTALREEFGL